MGYLSRSLFTRLITCQRGRMSFLYQFCNDLSIVELFEPRGYTPTLVVRRTEHCRCITFKECLPDYVLGIALAGILE